MMRFFKARSVVPALLAAAWLCPGTSAQNYVHRDSHWKIDFPAGWILTERSPRGAVCTAPVGLARLVVAKKRSGAKSPRAFLAEAGPSDLRRYGAARRTLQSDVVVRGHRGLRVEYDYADPILRRPMKAWRTILLENGIANVITFEASAEDYGATQSRAEGALRSFLPSFDPAGAQ